MGSTDKKEQKIGLPRYNLTRYNLPGEALEQTLLFSRRLRIKVQAVAGGRIYKLFCRTVRSVFRQQATAHAGIPFHRHVQMSFSGDFILYSIIPISRRLHSTFGYSVTLGKDMNVSRTSELEVKVVSHVGKWMHVARKAESLIQNTIHVGKEMPQSRRHWMMIDSMVLMGVILYARAVVNATIPPGGELRINSDAFTALLNGENILHHYEGDWTHFDRNTREFILHSSTEAPLAGNILYNWRFV